MLSRKIMQLHHSRTVQSPQMPYLSFDAGQTIPIQGIDLVVSLDGKALFVVLCNCHWNYRESSLANVRHHLQVLQHIPIGHKLIEVCNFFSDVVLTGGWTSGCLFVMSGIDSAHWYSSDIFSAAERCLVAQSFVLRQLVELIDDGSLNVPLHCIKTTLLSLTWR